MTAPSLSARLKAATRTHHRDAERAAVMRALLSGRLDVAGFRAMLRNLHALYDALERALDRHASDPAVAPLRMPALYRAAALRRDLAALGDSGGTLAPAMRAYVDHVELVARTQPALLAAHAYVRYMGDLSGGQLLEPLVRRAYAPALDAGVAFYAFGDAAEVAAHKDALRAAIDGLPLAPAVADALVAETRDAFVRHLQVFDELAPDPALSG